MNEYINKLYEDSGNEIIYITMIPLFTLGSIYCTNASGAEQMPERNNSSPNCKSGALTTRPSEKVKTKDDADK